MTTRRYVHYSECGPCSHCSAGTKSPCRSVTGNALPETHAVRVLLDGTPQPPGVPKEVIPEEPRWKQMSRDLRESPELAAKTVLAFLRVL